MMFDKMKNFFSRFLLWEHESVPLSISHPDVFEALQRSSVLPHGPFVATTDSYEDNEIVLRGLEISLSPHDWYKLVKEEFFLELLEYLAALEIRGSKSILDEVKGLSGTSENQ